MIGIFLSLRTGLDNCQNSENLKAIQFSDLSEALMVSHTSDEPKTEFKAVSLKTKKLCIEKLLLKLSGIPQVETTQRILHWKYGMKNLTVCVLYMVDKVFRVRLPIASWVKEYPRKETKNNFTESSLKMFANKQHAIN